MHTLTALFLAFIAQTALAQGRWQSVVERGGSDVYLDTASVTWSGRVASVRWVSNFSKPQSVRMGSGRITKRSMLYESRFDCPSKSYLIERAVWYEEAFAVGEGHILGRTNTPQWQTPSHQHYAGNLNVDVLNKVCG